MITQTNIECFLSLAETLSFTETANQLYMTQQAVSKSISRLEEDLGFLLFVRNPRSVLLTEEGRRCYELIKSLLEQFDNTLKEIRETYKKASITLNVGYQNWLDFGQEPGHAFSALCDEIPNLHITGERHPPPILRNLLLSRQLSMAIMYESFYDSLIVNKNNFKKLELFKTPQLIMVSPDHPKNNPSATWKDFIYEPLLFDVFEEESVTENNKRAKKIIEQCGLSPQKIVILPNRDSAYTEAEMGRGIVISSEINFLAQIKILKTFPIGVSETVICLWRADEKNSAVEKFAHYLRREYLNRD